MPMRQVTVKPRGREPESDIYRDFADLSLADRHTHGRSYRAGDHYSSSEPERDTRNPGRAYKNPVEPSYYGPHFEKGPAQEKLWDERGCKEVWNPREPMRPVATRPETYGRAHSVHQSRMDQPRISDPYEKRPMPYKERTRADYDTYKYPSQDHGAIETEMNKYKHTKVGRKIEPKYSHRDDLLKGKELSKAGRYMANDAVQTRAGFVQKYPQAYENVRSIRTHEKQVEQKSSAARNFRESGEYIDERLKAWERQMELRGRY